MSSDDYRPAFDQISTVYRCETCGNEITSYYTLESCPCGGHVDEYGESYPANPDEWEEQRDPDGVWRPRRH